MSQLFPVSFTIETLSWIIYSTMHLMTYQKPTDNYIILDKTNNVYGIDLFIGETNYLNQGIGTKMLSAVIEYIFEQLQAVKIVIDPDVSNTRANRCYEKCGFVKVKLLTAHQLHEGRHSDCWLMAINRKKSLH
ncbi:GNAT family N-acetyltransferase [Komarekiella delphini-convector]|uniref:GNAT family N-acetyltransferase n=1 Tax=Komarekiella delphini-convector TaxID=3050158 RepID=UPI0032AF28BB